MSATVDSTRAQAKAQSEDRDLTLADVKGTNTDGAWSEVPEDLYYVANYAAALGGEYPPENVDKSYWDQIKPKTYERLAEVAKSADPTTISQAQYVILMEAVVREAIRKDPKLSRPALEPPSLTPQQEYVWNWIQNIDNAEFLKWKNDFKLDDMTPEEWWAKIDDVSAENAAKGIKLPEMTLDLTNDEFLGVARDEFVKSIKQFLQVESEMYPVFILTMPGEEEGLKLVNYFNKTLDIPVRTYEVYGFDAYKFKVKASYDWGEARLQAIQELTGSSELPLVFVDGKLIGGPEKVEAAKGAIATKVKELRQNLLTMVERRYPKDEEESLYIGMRKVTAAEYKRYEENMKKNPTDPLEANRAKNKAAQQA